MATASLAPRPPATGPRLAAFDVPYAEDDVAIARRLWRGATLDPDAEGRIDARARDLIGAIRARAGG